MSYSVWRVDEAQSLLETLKAKGWSCTKIAWELNMTKTYLRSELEYARRHGLIAWKRALELKEEVLKS